MGVRAAERQRVSGQHLPTWPIERSCISTIGAVSRSPFATLDPHRLPHTALPRRYAVELEPDLAAATFTGSVVVDVDIAEPTDALVLNAIELQITSALVNGEPVEWVLDEPSERLALLLDAPLPAGAAQVEIGFDGILNDQLRGFYRSTYVDDDGVEQVIATTQMQSTDCRRAFPCWDEPEFKAVFGITLVVDPELTVVSNGSEIGREARGADRGDKVAVTFADTMVMSSYLVAFVVGKLEATDPIDVNGVPLRIYHVPGKGHLTGFGLEIGAFALAWFQEYYGIPYPSDKVDLLALPDFAAGAMENLGCITFREALLLVDPKTATHTEQETVADVVAHELAHMWFGDLVTMRWWNGIWLNEAFATFMEVAACDAFRPEWQRWTSFGLERSAAFETDSLASTRPVEFEVRSPADAEGMFDVLTYQKGGALLRMLEQYLRPDVFRRGVSHYLVRHSYGSTETADLWDALEEISGEPVREMMDSWIWQPGYPLVSAELRDGALALRQQRFAFEESDDPTTWLIPVHVRIGERQSLVVLRDAEQTIGLGDGDPGELGGGFAHDTPIVVNAGGRGFYRVAYSPELLGRLTGAALATLDTLERYNLVDDAWNSVVAGKLGAADFLAFAEEFAAERELAVWQALLIGLRAAGRTLSDDAYPRFQERVRALLAPVVADLGEPVAGEDDLRAKLRATVTAALAVLGDDVPTQQRLRAIYDRSVASPDADADGDELDAELVAAATTCVAATGDADDYDRMLARYRNAPTPQDALRHLYALAEFADEALIMRTCELCMSSAVKTQNAPFVLRLCINNRRNGAAAWRFVRSNWAAANAAFPRNSIVRMVSSVTALNTPELVADVAAFFAEHPIEQAAKTLDQVLERQRVNAALATREGERFAATL